MYLRYLSLSFRRFLKPQCIQPIPMNKKHRLSEYKKAYANFMITARFFTLFQSMATYLLGFEVAPAAKRTDCDLISNWVHMVGTAEKEYCSKEWHLA